MSLLPFVLFSCYLLFGNVQAVNMTGCVSDKPYIIEAFYHPSGDIYSPGFENKSYPNNLYCDYKIYAPSGHRVKLTFKEFDLDPYDKCMSDMLLIIDGRGWEDPLVGVFCGSEIPNPIYSPRNLVFIHFRTDFLVGRKGFHIQYELLPRKQSLCPEGREICRNRRCYKISKKCDGFDDCGDGTDEEKCQFPVQSTKCGMSAIQPRNDEEGRDRIVGGQPAVPGSWPWQADLQENVYYPNGHFCGGTLINSQWVLTAAHCVRGRKNPRELRIHLGNHNKYVTDPYEQIRYAERIVIFPDITGQQITNHVDMANDMALIKLNAPVQFTNYVKAACVPPQGRELNLGYQCVATGWGLTRGSGHNDVLKQVYLTVQYSSECKGETSFFVNKTMICLANDKGYQDVCHGDSGGPLVCQLSGLWNVMGVVSFGSRSNLQEGFCALPGTGSTYSKVSDKTLWISDTIERYN